MRVITEYGGREIGLGVSVTLWVTMIQRPQDCGDRLFIGKPTDIIHAQELQEARYMLFLVVRLII